MKCLALDFGGSSVKTALVDQQGGLYHQNTFAAPLKSRIEFTDFVNEIYREYEAQVSGIAISIPGYVNAEDGVLAETGMYQHLWGCCIPELLSDLECPITVENDGNCGALSEYWLGSLRCCQDGVVLVLGSGIGCGVIKEGKIHHGKANASGEVSYMILKPGKYGFLNSPIYDVGMIGMTYKMCLAKNLDLSIQDAADTLIAIDQMNPASVLKPESSIKIKADGKQMFQWLDENDEIIETIYKEFIQNLAAIINNIQVTFAPEKIAIGGGLSLQSRLFEDLNKELKQFYTSMGLKEEIWAEILPCQYLNETNLLGAAYNFWIRAGIRKEEE